MKKVFTKVLAVVMLLTSLTTIANAQRTLWPLATDTASVNASQFAHGGSIFWSRTGDLTPPTGFKGWVTKGIASADPAKKDSAVWLWRADAAALRGAYSGGLRAIGSPTKANGAAVFDSDFYDTKGSTLTPGTGQAPAGQESELISPTFDATGATEIVVQFHQYFRRFTNTVTAIQYSTDDGTTWSTKYTFNPESEVGVNQSTPNPLVATNTDSTLKRVILRGSVGSAKFKIKFSFVANYYFWIIDDVKIMDWKYFDTRVTNFFAVPQNVYTPKDQLEPMRFLADIANIGNKTMTNPKLVVKVWKNSDRSLVFADTTTQYPTTMKVDTSFENRILPKTFNTANLTPDIYVGSYRVIGDSSSIDASPGNDTARFVFVVSDTTAALSVVVARVGRSNYTKEVVNQTTTTIGSGFWTATEPKSIRVGNYYRIVKGPASTITSLLCRLNPFQAAGRTIAGTIYEWVDTNNDGDIQATERVLVAAVDTLISATVANANAWFLFRPLDIATGKLFRPKNNTNYLAMIEYDAVSLTAGALNFVFNTDIDYRATEFLSDSLGAPRYHMILGKSTDSDWFNTFFSGSNLVPCIRLNLAPFTTNTDDILSSDNKLTISPNPSSGDQVTLQFDMVQPLDAVLSIFSAEGRFMAEQNIEKLDKQTVHLEIKDYPAGIYLVQIITEKGMMTKRFVVTK